MKKTYIALILIFVSSLFLNANALENEIVRLINLERSKSALPPLPVNNRLNSLALYHSDNMAKNNFLSNMDLEGLNSQGRQVKLYPEMVGTVSEAFNKLDILPFTDKLAAEQIVKNIMSSPDYKRFMLSKDFNAIGVGAVKKGVGVLTTITFADIVAESVNFRDTAKEGEELNIQYRILNKAPFSDFQVVIEVPNKNTQVIGEDGKTYLGTVIYSVKDAGNTVVSTKFKADYGKGQYKVSLLYKGKHFQSNVRTITVR